MVKEYLDYSPPIPQESVGQESYSPMHIPRTEEKEEAAEIGIIKELSPRKILEQLRMNLKGFFWDYEQKAYIKIQGFSPLMNDKGIAKYLSIMSSVITDIVTFSNYRAEEINSLVLYICDKAIPTIHINYKEYGIQEKSDLQIIDVQIFNLTLAAFKKAVGAGDRNVVRGTVTESMLNRQMQMPIQPQSQGFLSRLNPFKQPAKGQL